MIWVWPVRAWRHAICQHRKDVHYSIIGVESVEIALLKTSCRFYYRQDSGPWQQHGFELNPLGTGLFCRNIKRYLHFLSFSDTGIAQRIKIKTTRTRSFRIPMQCHGSWRSGYVSDQGINGHGINFSKLNSGWPKCPIASLNCCKFNSITLGKSGKFVGHYFQLYFNHKQ